MRFSRYTVRVAMAVSVVLVSASAISLAQEPQAPPPEQRGRGGDGPQRFQPGPPGFALQEALDKDRDGKLSAKEVKTAVASLQALDRNSDGKLNAEEIGWPPQFGGRGGRGRGGRGGGFGGRGGRGGTPPAEFSKRIMSRDANSDGKVSIDELPRSMRAALAIADQNNDGAIDEAEAGKFAQTYGAFGRVTAPNPAAPNPAAPNPAAPNPPPPAERQP